MKIGCWVDLRYDDCIKEGGFQLRLGSVSASVQKCSIYQNVLTTLVKSCNAYPLSTALMRTACSLKLVALGLRRRSVTALRASSFKCGDKESSRSYTAKSTFNARDLYSIFREDPETVFFYVTFWLQLFKPGNFTYHRASLFSRQSLLNSSYHVLREVSPVYYLFECSWWSSRLRELASQALPTVPSSKRLT